MSDRKSDWSFLVFVALLTDQIKATVQTLEYPPRTLAMSTAKKLYVALASP